MSTRAYANAYIGSTVIVYELLTFIFYIVLFIPFIVDLHASKVMMSKKVITLVFFTVLLNAVLNIPPAVKGLKEFICKKLHRNKEARYSVQPEIEFPPSHNLRHL